VDTEGAVLLKKYGSVSRIFDKGFNAEVDVLKAALGAINKG